MSETRPPCGHVPEMKLFLWANKRAINMPYPTQTSCRAHMDKEHQKAISLVIHYAKLIDVDRVNIRKYASIFAGLLLKTPKHYCSNREAQNKGVFHSRSTVVHNTCLDRSKIHKSAMFDL